MKKTRKKLLAVLLAFTMLFGSSMTVFAQDYEWGNLIGGQTLTDQDAIIWSGVSANSYGVKLAVYETSSGTLNAEDENIGNYNVLLKVSVPTGKKWIVDRTESVFAETEAPSSDVYKVYVTETNAVPSTNPTPSSNPVEEPTKIEVHEHSYSWVTVQEASAGQDGIEEYRCSCGAVAERSIIPASQVFVKGLFGAIKNAPLNGTVTYDTGRLYTMSDYLIKKLAERSDVTVEIMFEYEKKPYKMVIPAGVDYAALLDDDENFYGYFYFAKVTGARIEEVQK